MGQIDEWIAARCELRDWRIGASVAYQDYKAWAQAGARWVQSHKALAMALKGRGVVIVRQRDGRYYHGIAIKPSVVGQLE